MNELETAKAIASGALPSRNGSAIPAWSRCGFRAPERRNGRPWGNVLARSRGVVIAETLARVAGLP